MGIQPVRDVDLIRHAYVLPGSQRLGIGSALLEDLHPTSTRRMLVGTWAAADWAIRFYERHGFELVPRERTASLLRSYWTIPERQIETSVVLADPPLNDELDDCRRCSRPHRAARLTQLCSRIAQALLPVPQSGSLGSLATAAGSKR